MGQEIRLTTHKNEGRINPVKVKITAVNRKEGPSPSMCTEYKKTDSAALKERKKKEGKRKHSHNQIF